MLKVTVALNRRYLGLKHMQLTSKLPHVGTTIFTVMSQMAAEYNAINLSQGFPDFDGPKPLRDLLCHYTQTGHNQYAPLPGVLALRKQLSLKIHRLYQRAVCPDQEITVVPGATEALYCAITATINTGDEVIIFDPAYDSYAPAVELNGGIPVHISMLPPSFGIDWDQVRDCINPRTRMIIINTPHNPSGTILQDADLQTLNSIIKDTNIVLLSDEVYEHLIFDGLKHASVLSYPELAERAFVVFSFGKTFHVTGWKTGFCVAPPKLMTEFRKIHQFVTFVAVTPIQHAIADFLEHCPEHYLGLPDFYQNKRDLFCKHLKKSKFEFTPAQGTYFQLVDYSNIRDVNDMEFVEYLTKEVGVAAIPISGFYKEPVNTRVIRFCFCKEDATLIEAADRLCKI